MGGPSTTSIPTAGVQPAPLDVYKKITVIRDKDDCVIYEDSQGRLQRISNLGEEALLATPSLQPKIKSDIPVPTIVNVTSYECDVPATYLLPRSYVRHNRLSETEIENYTEYNVDEEDEMWLENQPLFGSKALKGNITIDNKLQSDSLREPLPLFMFEKMIDILEKATAFETIITLQQAEHLIFGKVPSLLRIFPSIHPNKGDNKKNFVTAKSVVEYIYNYWVQKRSKLKKPLLRKFWPVTATNDTNPHQVFRPREKEKYKLRKKRQNDLDAYKKIKQLKADFQKARVLLELVKRREILNKCILDMQNDWFDQRLYELVDTSGLPRESDRLSRKEIEEALTIPKFVDTEKLASKMINKKRKKGTEVVISGASHTTSDTVGMAENDFGVEVPAESKTHRIAADPDHPITFLHPLNTRESYATTWDDAVPFITSYVDSIPTNTTRFRHRPRIGRGGRIIIDRVPRPTDENQRQVIVLGLGSQIKNYENKSAHHLLDLLPEPLDKPNVSRRIESISAMAMIEDQDNASKQKTVTIPSQGSILPDSIPTEDVLVKTRDWIDTDEQYWGIEYSVMGPV